MGTQAFIPRDYDVFAGLDVDKKSISVTFSDHQGFLKVVEHAVQRRTSCESCSQALWG